MLKTMSYTRGSYGGGRINFGGPKPVEMGKEYVVQISEQGRQGDGVARIQGFIIFVKDGKMGEKTRIKITRVGDRSADAHVIAGAVEEKAQAEATASVPEKNGPETIETPVTQEKADLRDYKAPGRRKDF